VSHPVPFPCHLHMKQVARKFLRRGFFSDFRTDIRSSQHNPTDIVPLVVLWQLRYKLSLRDLAEGFLERGFEFTRRASPGLGNALCPVACEPTADQKTRTSREILVQR
jgi:hypothetical protein